VVVGAQRLRIAVAVVALGFVFALVVGAAGIGENTKAFGAGTTLTIISGEVMVRHGASVFTIATDGDVLSEGDAIRTGAEGRAILTYFEGSTVTIEPATELAIDAANATVDGSTVVSMTQSVGRTWHVVTKLITGGSKYEVRTPANTASVRGTEFQVDADSATTTLTTTEGTVLAQVPDPARQGAVVDVPVTAGATHMQTRNAPPAPARAAPEPEREVTVTVGATNTLVVDPLGRANGVTKDGKLIVQTPGAQVKRDGGTIVVTLPNIPDGRLAAVVDKKDDGDDSDVFVVAKVDEKGLTTLVADRTVTKSGESKKSAGIELKRGGDGTTNGRALNEDEVRSLPAGRTADPKSTSRPRERTAVPASTRRATPTVTLSPSPSPTKDARRTPELTQTPKPSQSPRAQPSGDDPTPVGGFIPVRALPSLPVPSAAASSDPLRR